MDISGVTFDVNGWFNSGNALHALFIYHDVTYEKIIQIDKIFGQFYEIDIQVSYQWYYFRLHSPRLVKQLKKIIQNSKLYTYTGNKLGSESVKRNMNLLAKRVGTQSLLS